MQASGWNGSYFHTTRVAAARAYEEAGITNPRDQLSLIEVHDCFSVTELVTMEELHNSEEGQGWRDILNGFFDANGQIPCQIDVGLKSFDQQSDASEQRDRTSIEWGKKG